MWENYCSVLYHGHVYKDKIHALSLFLNFAASCMPLVIRTNYSYTKFLTQNLCKTKRTSRQMLSFDELSCGEATYIHMSFTHPVVKMFQVVSSLEYCLGYR